MPGDQYAGGPHVGPNDPASAGSPGKHAVFSDEPTKDLVPGEPSSGASGAEWVTLFDLSTETDLSKFTATGVNAWSIAGGVITWNGAEGDSGVLYLDLTAATRDAIDEGVILELYYTLEARITAALPSGSFVSAKVQRGVNGVEFADDGRLQGLEGIPAAAVVNTWYSTEHRYCSPVFQVGQLVGVDSGPRIEEGGGITGTTYSRAVQLTIVGDDGTIGLQARNAKVSALVLPAPAVPV